MNITDVTRDIWIEHEEECEALLEQCALLPLLNANSLEDLQDGKLVRFYGMVQDMFSPEYYFEKCEVIQVGTNEKTLKSAKFSDVLRKNEGETFNTESKNNVISERTTFVVISVPGENEWIRNFQKLNYTIKNENKTDSCTVSNKRPLETDIINNTEHDGNSHNKRPHINAATSSRSVVSHEHLLNLPIPDLGAKVCHAKVYKNSDEIKLNDLVEIIGFLSVDPLLVGSSDGEDEDNIMEMQTHNPPPSLVPRIHCVAWKKIEHSNFMTVGCEGKMESEKCQFLKKELHLVLTQLFMGDPVAAEYFIYHLISKVQVSNERPIGKFTLNISQIPICQVPEYGTQLYLFIENLLPKSYYLPMTLENMNELAFTPKKDYECERITSGLLQLSNNTHLVLDETRLQPGRLNELGVRAVNALTNTIKSQKVIYDFNYFPMEFDCDIPFLILSEGKSLLPSDFHVPLKPDDVCINTFNEIVEAVKQYLNVQLLNNIRIYLTLARFAQYSIDDDEVINLTVNDFLRMRQAGTANEEDLHQLLALARLICLSEGKTSLDRDCWARACELEVERKKRLS